MFSSFCAVDEAITYSRPTSGNLNHEFRKFINDRPVQGPSPISGPSPKLSKKPLIIFLAIFGIPYAMTKLVRILSDRARVQAASNGGGAVLGQMPPLESAMLTFARALYNLRHAVLWSWH